MFYPICNEKIGNLLLYLAEKIHNLHLTKLLKIIYIIDETAVRETGVPVTWLDYQVWEFGPIPKDLYEGLMYGEIEMHQYSFLYNKFNLNKFVKVERKINLSNKQADSFAIFPNAKFDNGEFNDYEMELIDKTIDTYKSLSSEEITNQLNEKDTLWKKMANSKALQRSFWLKGSRSNHTIDFTDLLEEDSYKAMAYKAAYEAIIFQKELRMLAKY